MDLFSKIITVFLVTSLLVACSRYEKEREQTVPDLSLRLAKADSLLLLRPDSALYLASKIAWREKKNNAAASLICAKAMAILGRNDEAVELFDRLLIDSINQGNGTIYCQAKFEIGKLLYYQGKYDSALAVFNQLQNEPCVSGDSAMQGWILLFQGKDLRVKGEYGKSQQCYIKCKAIAKHCDNKKLLATVLISMGKNNIVEGSMEMALENYLEAFKLSEPLPDRLLFGDVCNHLGGYYLQANQFDKALEYHFKALYSRELLSAPDEIGQSYNNIGKTYLEMGQTDSARAYFEFSIKIFKKSHYMKGIVKTLTNLGKLNLFENKIDEANYYLKSAYDYSVQSGYNLGIAESGIELGNFYLSKHQPDSAIYYYSTCSNRFESQEYDDLFIDVNNGMYKAYRAKGNYKTALHYHGQLLKTEKRKLNVENNRQLANLLLEFDYERKESDNRILKKENELKSLVIRRNELVIWFTLIALILTILLCLLIYSRLKFKVRANKQLKELNTRVSHQNEELEILNENLQSANRDKDKLFSIISHELRNPLFWFQNLTAMLSKNFRKMDEEKLNKSIASLNDSAQNIYHLMDNLLFWSRSQLHRIVPRFSEIRLSEKTMEVTALFKNIAESKEIQLSTNIDCDLNVSADPELLSCILRNLLSNAIKYTPNKGSINIAAYEQAKLVLFEITDTGEGFPVKSFNKVFKDKHTFSVPGILNEKGSGLGLKLCKEFIEIHQGEIWLEPSSANGTKVCFSISKTIENQRKQSIITKSISLIEG